MKLWQGGRTLLPIIQTLKYKYLWTFVKEFTTKTQIMEWVTTIQDVFWKKNQNNKVAWPRLAKKVTLLNYFCQFSDVQ